MVFDILYQGFDVMKNGYCEDEYGTQRWYKNGELHHEDGPAVIWSNGHQEWWVNGERHREYGPAYINPNGTQVWYINGKFHREDGPARIWADGTQDWWVNGKRITNEVNEWLEDYNLSYDTLTDEEKWCLIFYIRSLM